MHVGLRRPPDQTSLVEIGRQIGERRKVEIVNIVGKLVTGELVALLRRNTGGNKDLGGKPNGRPKDRKWPGALLIDVLRQQLADPRRDLRIGGYRSQIGIGEDISRSSGAELSGVDGAHRPDHPRTERFINAVSQSRGKCGERF